MLTNWLTTFVVPQSVRVSGSNARPLIVSPVGPMTAIAAVVVSRVLRCVPEP